MSLYPLLNGETIKIDNHHSGQEINLDDQGLHLHKRFNVRNRKRGIVDVRIPLNGEIRVIDEDGDDAPIIVKELRKAFKDKAKRERFLDGFKKALTSISKLGRKEYSGDNGTQFQNDKKIELEKITQIVRSLMVYFGLSEEIIKEYLKGEDDTISVKIEGKRPAGYISYLYAKVNKKECSLAFTQNREMLNII